MYNLVLTEHVHKERVVYLIIFIASWEYNGVSSFILPPMDTSNVRTMNTSLAHLMRERERERERERGINTLLYARNLKSVSDITKDDVKFWQKSISDSCKVSTLTILLKYFNMYCQYCDFKFTISAVVRKIPLYSKNLYVCMSNSHGVLYMWRLLTCTLNFHIVPTGTPGIAPKWLDGTRVHTLVRPTQAIPYSRWGVWS